MRASLLLLVLLAGCTIQEVTLYKTVNMPPPSPPQTAPVVRPSGIVTPQ